MFLTLNGLLYVWARKIQRNYKFFINLAIYKDKTIQKPVYPYFNTKHTLSFLIILLILAIPWSFLFRNKYKYLYICIYYYKYRINI